MNEDDRVTEPTLAEVHAFLLGEGPLLGCWYGDDTRPPLHQAQPFWWRKYLRAASLQGADTVTEAQVKAALDAIVPGGARVWHWLPTDKGGQKPHRTARNVMRCALEAAMRAAAPTAQDDTGARLDADWKQLRDDLAKSRGEQSPVDGPRE